MTAARRVHRTQDTGLFKTGMLIKAHPVLPAQSRDLAQSGRSRRRWRPRSTSSKLCGKPRWISLCQASQGVRRLSRVWPTWASLVTCTNSGLWLLQDRRQIGQRLFWLGPEAGHLFLPSAPSISADADARIHSEPKDRLKGRWLAGRPPVCPIQLGPAREPLSVPRGGWMPPPCITDRSRNPKKSPMERRAALSRTRVSN